MLLTRRQFAALSAAGAAALALPFAAPALAQDAKPDVKMEDLLKEGAAKDYCRARRTRRSPSSNTPR